MDFETYITERKIRIDRVLQKHLPSIDIPPSKLHKAMHYTVFNGGKRFRPLLVYAVGEALGASLEDLDIPACAIELIHTYSLVHDDLPAMDNDDLRRGKPTCHKAFDEATAILVGDALQTLAFQILAEPHFFPANTRLSMLSLLAKASGSLGMAGGQSLDLTKTEHVLNLQHLETIYGMKTGALIGAAVQLGALASTPIDSVTFAGLEHFATCLGLSFQIQDDLLDSTPSEIEQLTYPALLGLEGAKEKMHYLQQEAINALIPLGSKADYLRQLIDFSTISSLIQNI